MSPAIHFQVEPETFILRNLKLSFQLFLTMDYHAHLLENDVEKKLEQWFSDVRSTAQKWSFLLRISSVMWPNLQFSADLVTFTEDILNGKLHFLCSLGGLLYSILLFPYTLQALSHLQHKLNKFHENNIWLTYCWK